MLRGWQRELEDPGSDTSRRVKRERDARIAECEARGHLGFVKTEPVKTFGTVRGICKDCGATLDCTVDDEARETWTVVQ